jgi:hypothetical protein
MILADDISEATDVYDPMLAPMSIKVPPLNRRASYRKRMLL